MIGEPTHYETLGVLENATPDEIKTAYRQLARKYHPDRNPGDPRAEPAFKKVGAAYDVLGNAAKRREYDDKLSRDRAAARAEAARQEAMREAARHIEEERARKAAAEAAARAVPPVPAQPAASKPTGPSPLAVFATIVAAGALAAALGGGGASEKWDRRAGRYRGRDGRFTGA